MKKLLITGLLLIACCLSGCRDLDWEIKYDKIDNPYEKVATTREVNIPILTSKQTDDSLAAGIIESSDDTIQEEPIEIQPPVSNPVETKAPIQIDEPKDKVEVETEIITDDDIISMAENATPASTPETTERLMPVDLTDTEDVPTPAPDPEPEVKITYEMPEMLFIDGNVDASSINLCIEQLNRMPDKMQDAFVAEGWQLILTDESIDADIEPTGVSYLKMRTLQKPG